MRTFSLVSEWMNIACGMRKYLVWNIFSKENKAKCSLFFTSQVSLSCFKEVALALVLSWALSNSVEHTIQGFDIILTAGESLNQTFISMIRQLSSANLRQKNFSSQFLVIIYACVSSAPSQVNELRAEKVEQRSVTLVWREPVVFPNSSRTEYEIKYYEKVLSSSVKH